MRLVGRSLRHASHITRSWQANSCLQGGWHARGYIEWGALRNKLFRHKLLAPGTREQPSTEAAREQRRAEGNDSLFDVPTSKEKENVKGNEPERVPVAPKKKFKEHKYSTATFRISHRKLNMLGRQISGKPIDYAILQMQFSEKRASRRLKSMLVLAKQHAINYKNLDPSKLIVSESWVTKGPNTLKRLEIRGRGHHGIRVHPDSRMTVVLREGKTFAEKKSKEREKKLRAVRSAGVVREDVPLRNPAPMWGW